MENLLQIDLPRILRDHYDWPSLYAALCSHSSSGKLFEQFCKAYFLYGPSVKDDYKNVYLFGDVPFSIRQQLRLSTIDHGVDLVLENQDGTWTMVQCKFIADQTRRLCWGEPDKLSHLFAAGKKADHFIIFTNASKISAHAEKMYKENLTVISVSDPDGFSEEIFTVIQNGLARTPSQSIQKKTPKPHQEIAIEKTINAFQRNDRGQLILPCGTGKTLISLWTHEKLNPSHTLVLFPSLALLRQTKNEWNSNRESYVPYICVCSEKDIDSDSKSSDRIKTHLCEIGGPVTTDPQKIKTFLTQNKKTIIFATYQSLKEVQEAVKDSDFIFDLAICDEAHKTAGGRKSSFTLIHHDIPIRKRLYMTATPRVFSAWIKEKAEKEERPLYDMSDPKTFGPEFHRMTFKEAIDQGILVDYKIVVVGATEKLAKSIQDRPYVSENETLDEIADNHALHSFMEKHDSSHAITFHSSVKKAQAFQKRHNEIYSDVRSFHVNGEESTNTRSLKLKEFSSIQKPNKAIMTNSKCLTEGIDVPAIDAVYFCDPKSSVIEIVQAAGRALRTDKKNKKKCGYIVIPLYHQENVDVEEFIDKSTFRTLINVVRALSSQDERLVAEINALREKRGKRILGSNHISFDMDSWIITWEGFTNEEWKEKLVLQVLDKTPIDWVSFEEAREWARKSGLKSQNEWKVYVKKGMLPQNIPSKPDYTYKGKGWKKWGDWLGTGRIADQDKEYRSFEEARIFARSLKLKKVKEWYEISKSGKLPPDIPASVDKVYAGKGWIDWGDFLGNESISSHHKKFRNFSEARAYVHKLELKNPKEWQAYASSGKRPQDIPAAPNECYQNKGWAGWPDWLGYSSGRGSKKFFVPYKEAKMIVHKLQLKSVEEWRELCKRGERPLNMPSSPNSYYEKQGWSSWNEFLGIRRNFLPYEEAKIIVHRLKLKTIREWKSYAKSDQKPKDIPSSPDHVYKNKGWISWRDWLR